MKTSEATPSFPTMWYATGQRVPDVDALRRDEGRSWFQRAVAICHRSWVMPDPSLPALDTIYPVAVAECTDADALCVGCGLLTRTNPARQDCESCARGAA